MHGNHVCAGGAEMKIRRMICGAVGFLAFIIMLGVVGGTELSGLPLGRGLLISGGLMILSIVSFWFGGYFA